MTHPRNHKQSQATTGHQRPPRTAAEALQMWRNHWDRKTRPEQKPPTKPPTPYTEEAA